ncbi:MAG TPA: FliM/FliN family flagellar motor switch protein, partial [Acidimicrobiales bacterium]|nr:FliM/FliN family flagellar motor switch protein [Acidimicrobiales bacterium]
MTLDSEVIRLPTGEADQAGSSIVPERTAGALEESWDRRMARLKDVPLRITVLIGRTRLPIRAVLDLHVGQVIELDRAVGAPVDVVA